MSTLVGQKVWLPADCLCGANIAVLGSSNGKYYATLTCGCGRNRGSITEFTGKWIEAVTAKFGAPETMTLRRTIIPVEVEQSPDNAGISQEPKTNV